MTDQRELVAQLAALGPEERKLALRRVGPRAIAALRYAWLLRARDEQLAPAEAQGGGPWSTWLVLAGRGFGKTRTAVEWVRREVESGAAGRVALIAPTSADARDVLVEGVAGILAMSPSTFRPTYEPSKRRLTWPNGAVGTLFSADEPDRLRGPQHDRALCDEVAAWPYPDETWDNLRLGLRVGPSPRALAATTPRPIPLIKRLLADPRCAVTRGSTYANAANLPAEFLRDITEKYEGTRLGRQELHAEILEDAEGALWRRAQIEALRRPAPAQFRRVIVAVDPAVSSSAHSDETGIVVVGVGDCSCRGRVEQHAFVLADLSGRHTPDAWAQAVLAAYRGHGCDRIVAEVNNGGDLVEANLRAREASERGGKEQIGAAAFRSVHASRGKATRAEPVAALYEQARVHHARALPALEDQMCSWSPSASERSPDRVDALTWALTDLMLARSDFGSDVIELPRGQRRI